MQIEQELAGRRALVTGASRGIGAAIAQRLLDAGAKVAIAARTRSDVTPAAASFVHGDVRTPEGVKAIADATLSALGGLDILVNNAGGSRAFLKGSDTIAEEEWQDGLALNLLSAVRLTNALLPALRASKAAAIVNISSTAATMPFGAFAHYCAAKAALDMYSRTVAMELAPQGIRVNVVTPGPIVTPDAEELRKTFTDGMGLPEGSFVQHVPLGRLGRTEDVAEMVALLVSDRGAWLTGGNYRVDGGMAAR